MKPISVRFKCFGPYLNEQYIEFAPLEKNGLFLICGETGSGKTTILDAMCYALYGKSSGGLRGDISVMRCKQAKEEDETLVEYTFSSEGSVYRFYRSLKPRKRRKASSDSDKKQAPDMNESCGCLIEKDGQFVPLADAKDKKTYLNEKAKEIIGLTYDQFRQVIILPQGQFEKLLVSDSEEKEKILVTLFHAERWNEISKNIFETADQQRKKLTEDKLYIDNKLKEYGCGSVEELIIAGQKVSIEAETLKAQLLQAEQQLKLLQDAYQQAALDNKDFEQLDEYEKKLNNLQQKEEAFRLEGEKLKKADQADQIEPEYRDYKNSEGDCILADKTLRTEETLLEKAKAAMQEAEEKNQLHEDQKNGYEKKKAKVILLENAETIYRSLAEKEKKCADFKKAADKAQKEAQADEKALEGATFQMEEAVKNQRAAAEQYQAAQELYLQSIGSTLAEKLKEGQKCPVCGSTHHPDPARHIAGHVTEEELKNLSENVKNTTKLEEKRRKERKEAENKKQESQNKCNEAKQNFSVADQEFKSALNQKIEGIDTEKQRAQQLKTLKTQVSDYEKESEAVQKQLNDARTDLKTAQKQVKTAEKKAEETREKLEEEKKKWFGALSSMNFEDEKTYLTFRMDANEKQRRQKALIQFETDLRIVRKNYKEQKDLLAQRQRPDVDGADKRVKEGEKFKNDINDRYVLQNSRSEQMIKDAALLEKRQNKYQADFVKNENDMVFAKRLRGDFGISLQRYVLGVMLTSITRAANRLLKTMYGGRYQLYRTNETAGSARKRGLELEVEDINGRRSVTTLSGGEKFLLSLSLAIGLSTVVQSQGSGVRLEAMFIDEGFGSLDTKSIDDAMEVLQNVQKSSGLVGIISHVERLEETIPAKIVITKTKNGSESKVCC